MYPTSPPKHAQKTTIKKSISKSAMADALLYFYSSISIILLLLAFNLFFPKRHKNLPPSPPALPLIGHLHLLKHPVHRALQKISFKYGPIFSLRYGSRLVVVVSSPSGLEECFTKNDIVFANRPRLITGKHLDYNYTTVVTTPYGEHWRNLRRIGALEIFNANRLNSYLGIRQDEVLILLRRLLRSSVNDFAKVELKSSFWELTFNNIIRIMAGKRYYGEEVEDQERAKQFRQVMREILEYGGASHPGDFMPFLMWFGRRGFEKKVKNLAKRTDALFQTLIDDHRATKRPNTLIDYLLSLQQSQPLYYTDDIIKGLIMVLLIGGNDTTAVTLEWAMTNLIKYPNVLKKVRAEIDAQVGEERLMDESDIENLPYLKNITSETFRLFPATPMLVPHMPSEDSTIAGYSVPRDTILLANVWGMHRDPNLWDDPDTFRPERFEKGENENCKILPFGLGRRACPGAGMARKVVGLTLGSLIQCFDWKKYGDKEIDMAEGEGLTMPKAEPLEAMCRARPIMSKISL